MRDFLWIHCGMGDRALAARRTRCYHPFTSVTRGGTQAVEVPRPIAMTARVDNTAPHELRTRTMPFTRTSAGSLSEQATNGTKDTAGEAGLVPRFALF